MIQVFVPTDYKPGSGKKYDVIYVLDGGNWNVGLVSRTQRFVEKEGFMPSTIIVSVMGISQRLLRTASIKSLASNLHDSLLYGDLTAHIRSRQKSGRALYVQIKRKNP